MATKIGSLFGDVSLRTASLDKDIASVGKKMKKMGAGMSAIGKDLSLKLTAPIAAIGVAALLSFGQFEKGMNEVRSLMPNLNQGEFVQLQEDVRDLAVEMGVNAVEAVGALYQAISAGVPKDNVIDFLRVSTKTAIAGLTDVTTAVDGITTVLNAYKMEAGEAEKVSDVLFTAVRLGKTNFSELSTSLFQAAPMAAAMNVPLEEISAAVTTLTKQGVPTSVAMTQIRASLVGLAKPTSTMTTALKNMKDESYESGQALLDSKGYLGALEALRTDSGLTSEELAKAFGSVEGLGAVLAQTGSNFDGAIDDLKAMTESSGAMNKAFEENNKGMFRSFEKTKTIITEVSFLIGEQLAPHAERAATAFKEWYKANAESVPGWVGIAVKIAAVAAILGPILLVVGKLVVVFSSVYAWVILLAAGFAALLIKFEVFTEMGEALGQLIADIFINKDITAAIGSLLGLIGEVIEAFTGIQFSAERVRTDVINIFRSIGRAIDVVVGKLGQLWELFGKVTGATALGNGIGNLIGNVAFRAEGGPVSAGSPYIVGEQGPELMVPRYSGSIVPNHALGGSSGGITMNFAPGTGMETVAALRNMKGTLAQWAVAAVREDSMRRV